MCELLNWRHGGGCRRLEARVIVRILATAVLFASVLSPQAMAQTSDQQVIAELKATVQRLAERIESMEARLNDESARHQVQQSSITTLTDRVDQLQSGGPESTDSALSKFHFGGYGELHGNFGESSDADLIDLHRLVLYLGYDFADWIEFHSEWELEHGFVSKDADGEFVIEQAYFDFLLNDSFNIRAGRVLTPLGIINKYHEPALFNSVERPSFAKFIIPTTWSSDGIGIFGNLSDELSYEAYVVGGLDGSQFNATNGIRDGRIKERPGLHEPAFTGRIDYYPLASSPDSDQDLRFGLSAYGGGLDNSNKGEDLPGLDADIRIFSADVEYSYSKFDFSGAIAHTKIDGAKNIAGVAEEIFGWYAEGAYHFWPDEWKKGKLAKSDAVVFLRYDDFDTQYKMPSGVSRDPAGDRTEWTFGVAFWPVPNFVIKADYQIRQDGTDNKLNDLLNLGVGFAF